MNEKKESQQLLTSSPRTLHLFAGAGGGLLADVLLGHRPVCAVEINSYRRRVIRQRQTDKILPWFPVFKDVRKFNDEQWKGVIDIVCGGFPCQPYSIAGKKKGKEDHRNLWPDTIRIIREVGPSIAFLENVPGLLSYDYFGEILGSLAECGYDAEWDVISAASLGAPHIRERLWIFAYRNEWASWTRRGSESKEKTATTINPILCEWPSWWTRFRSLSPKVGEAWESRVWIPKPSLCRMDDGMANRMDRIAALGDGQVPQVAAFAFRLLCYRAGINLSTQNQVDTSLR